MDKYRALYSCLLLLRCRRRGQKNRLLLNVPPILNQVTQPRVSRVGCQLPDIQIFRYYPGSGRLRLSKVLQSPAQLLTVKWTLRLALLLHLDLLAQNGGDLALHEGPRYHRVGQRTAIAAGAVHLVAQTLWIKRTRIRIEFRIPWNSTSQLQHTFPAVKNVYYVLTLFYD